MALLEEISLIFSTVSVLVPGAAAELRSIPFTDDCIPSRHSPVETN